MRLYTTRYNLRRCKVWKVSDPVSIFVDTNAFLQLRDLKDLPWRDVFPDAKGVDVYVASFVYDELDKFKVSTNQRQRNRARLALRLIEEVSQQPDFTHTVRTTPIVVRLIIASGKGLWNAFPDLDMKKPDDRLVAEAAGHPGAVVFSHDTGPRIQARRAKITAIAPPDDWHLPDEQTDKDRQISKLEADLTAARRSKPLIKAAYKSEVTEFKIPELAPLSSYHCHRAVEAYLVAHPKIMRGSPYPSMDRDRDKRQAYLNDYHRFEKDCMKYFEELHTKLLWYGRCVRMPYSIENDSEVAAQVLRLEMRVNGAYLLATTKGPSFPWSIKPPKAPKPKEAVPGLSAGMRPTIVNGDPAAFYWAVQPETTATYGVLVCPDFHPKREQSNVQLCFVVGGALPRQVELSINISATNMPEPQVLKAQVTIGKGHADWNDDWVRQLLPPTVRDCIPRN